MPTIEEYARLVRAMQAHQDTYFRTKQGLDHCKAAEKAVKAATAEILDRNLFSQPTEEPKP